MALSTHPAVWKTLALIALVITAVLAACFYFLEIFLTFLIGFSLIVITRKLVSDFRASVARYPLTPLQRRLIGYGLVSFWLFSVLFLVHSSLDQISNVIEHSSSAFESLQQLYAVKVAPHLPDWLTAKVLTPDRMGRWEREAALWVTDAFTMMSHLFVYGALLIPLMFYTHFSRGEAIARQIHNWVPANIRARYARTTREIGENLYEYFRARVIEGVAVGSLCCLGFYVGGVKGWLILGLIAGILNVADFVGPALSLVPPVAISLLADDPFAAGAAIVTVLVAQLVDNFFLVPFLISSKVQINPLLTITLILIGGHVMGITGIVLAIPVYLIYKIVLMSAYEEMVALRDPNAALA